MNGAWLPLWIIGGPFLGLLFLSSIYKGGSSTSSAVDRGPRESGAGSWSPSYVSTARAPTDYTPTTYRQRSAPEESATLDTISRLSGPVNPGPVSELSGHKSPGAISKLSGWKSPGAISRLSASKPAGAISRLSGHKSPGAIAELSRTRPAGSIAKLSGGFYFSHVFGLPLLTRSQSPSEPEDTLLLPERRQGR